jgi:hypothetical protein
MKGVGWVGEGWMEGWTSLYASALRTLPTTRLKKKNRLGTVGIWWGIYLRVLWLLITTVQSAGCIGRVT